MCFTSSLPGRRTGRQPTAASATMPTCITLNIVPTWIRRFHVSPEHHVLVLDGYSGSEYHPILGFLNVGDFHGCEPWLYQESLHENILERVKAYYRNGKQR